MVSRLCNVLIVLFVQVAVYWQADSGINKTDADGKRQGRWMKTYRNGAVMYDGVFRNGYPEGEFRRYYENGVLQSVLVYSEQGTEADATIYHPNGFVSARGRYVNRRKEGVWEFYSRFENGYVVVKELYADNMRNGESLKLYQGGVVAERMSFRNDTASGEWIKYFPDGGINLKTTMAGGMIDGRFEAWFDNGQLQFSGTYSRDKKDGLWRVYEKDGTLRYEINYDDGITSDRLIDIDTDRYIDSLERDAGKIPDPEKQELPF
ncbi:MAG: hypothetical protein LBV26_08690 [Bacteroidales bacterium]|jgi:antitoxin component YwqK of YwqJK toxin-antitoxin module|nr:hypothetical protein [Bacteroidales bacterium]